MKPLNKPIYYVDNSRPLLYKIPKSDAKNIELGWWRVFLTTGLLGAFSDEATPVPIPNTAVKLVSGDDTPLGESSTVPDF